ncbi:serine hydrolase [Streptomyces sp. Ag109_G2-15]|uniref:serine hydrolase n=1 Tax=Streptomyces sp. Ag109_G2-15 TaxID=1938850 RepID=UPI000BD49938|nr:serine hydrolase [Streptomyces sp. Ag109_G2-15]SOD91231.1 Beta-lactamase class A [Streptomyces sp. Ag109_G2-15]
MAYRIRSLSLAAAVSTLLSAGALAPASAAAATTSTRSGSAPADFPTSVGAQGKARVTAAVLDLDGTGRTPAVYGDDAPYDTASIIKVDILASVLLQVQDSGKALTAKERAQAEAMIEHSDNAAANSLWRRIGLAPGLKAANKRLGLTATQGGPDVRWGLTRTTASDQIRLLRAVFDTGPAPKAGSAPALGDASRGYIRTLMSRIADDQSWGVSAAAGSEWALKNGWLQRNTTGLWDVNSVGRITTGGHHYLVAVLSDGNTSMKDGVALVERAARAAVTSTTAH